GARDLGADLADYLDEISARFLDEARIGRHTVHQPEHAQLPDRLDLGRVHEEFHDLSLVRKGSALVVARDTSPRYCAMEPLNPPLSHDPRAPAVPAGAAVAVLIVERLDRLLDYRAPVGGVSVGDLVEVPLG